MSLRKVWVLILLILPVALSGHAYGSSLEYNFSANWSMEIEGPISGPGFPPAPLDFYGAGDIISGSFTYDSSVPGTVLNPGLTFYVGAISNLQVPVNGDVFSDPIGRAVVDHTVDRIQLVADPPADQLRNITGYNIGPFELYNVRLFWEDLAQDVITNDALPPFLPPPGFESGDARVALDFANGPLNDSSTLRHIVLFENLQVNAIPEPSTMLLFGSGLAGLGLWRHRSRFERVR